MQYVGFSLYYVCKAGLGHSISFVANRNSVSESRICAFCRKTTVNFEYLPVLYNLHFCAQLHYTPNSYISELRNAATLLWICVQCNMLAVKLSIVLHRLQFKSAVPLQMNCELYNTVSSINTLILHKTQFQRAALFYMNCDLGSAGIVKLRFVLHKPQIL